MSFLQKTVLVVWILVIGALAIIYLDIIMKPLPTIDHNRTIEEYIEEIEIEEPSKSLGEFTITHYCSCEKCCGKWADGITASGSTATENRTIAVDPSVISLGSVVYIDGVGEFVAEDTGSAIVGNRIDIYCGSHEEAITRGIEFREVFIDDLR